ncbi:MAG: RidA family protein [Chloroflexi bacterium]|nr:MAG: RidA family protein [Chloroflexota bacterium]
MAKRQNISSGAVWESVVGYSRAVRVGNRVLVAGTTASDENGQVLGVGNAAEQTRIILKKIEQALKEAGAELRHVVRTRIFVTNIDDWEAIGNVHGEIFGNIRPVATMVEVRRLINPQHLVEIEAEAVIYD